MPMEITAPGRPSQSLPPSKRFRPSHFPRGTSPLLLLPEVLLRTSRVVFLCHNGREDDCFLLYHKQHVRLHCMLSCIINTYSNNSYSYLLKSAKHWQTRTSLCTCVYLTVQTCTSLAEHTPHRSNVYIHAPHRSKMYIHVPHCPTCTYMYLTVQTCVSPVEHHCRTCSYMELTGNYIYLDMHIRVSCCISHMARHVQSS